MDAYVRPLAELQVVDAYMRPLHLKKNKNK